MPNERALTIDQGANSGAFSNVNDGDTLIVGEGIQASEADANLSLRVGSTGTTVGVLATLLDVGKGTDVDIFIRANNGDANAPALKYDSAGSKWQYSNDGTTFYDIGGGGSLPAGTSRQHIEYVGAAWTAVSDLTLPSGSRVISVDSAATGSLLQVIAGAASTPDNVGGSLELIAGAGAGAGTYGDIRVGASAAGVARAAKVRIGKINAGTENQITVDEANYTTDINGLLSLGGGDSGGTYVITNIVWQHAWGGGTGGLDRVLRVQDPQGTPENCSMIKIQGAAGRNNASGSAYKGSPVELNSGIGGDSLGGNGTGGFGGGGDWYGGDGGAGDGTGDGGDGGSLTLHGGAGGRAAGSGTGGVGGSIYLKPGVGQSVDGGYDGAVIVGHPGFIDDYTYLMFANDDGVYAPWSNGPGFRWDWLNNRMQVYTGATGAGSWSNVATGSGGGVLRGEYCAVAAVVTTANTGYTTIGAIPLLDPTDTDATAYAFVFEIFQSGGGTASIRLYNATDDVEVNGTETTSTSTTPERTRVNITSATGFSTSVEKSYEVQLKVTTGAAICRGARIEYTK